MPSQGLPRLDATSRPCLTNSLPDLGSSQDFLGVLAPGEFSPVPTKASECLAAPKQSSEFPRIRADYSLLDLGTPRNS